MTDYYHGGRGKMMRGQYILPPSITGAKTLADYGDHLCDVERVYITTDFNAAVLYAAGVNGEVYKVEPAGKLKDDPDCKTQGLSFHCEKAKIIKRYRLRKAVKEAALMAMCEL